MMNELTPTTSSIKYEEIPLDMADEEKCDVTVEQRKRFSKRLKVCIEEPGLDQGQLQR